MRQREHEPPMAEPLAYFITWGTYGTWLPGDERGWSEFRHGWRLPDPVRKLEAASKMTDDACVNETQRSAVHEQISETCAFRGWALHAVNCRSNHLHLVVTASASPKIVRSQLKAWCTRRLNQLEIKSKTPSVRMRKEWWAERGSQRHINDIESLEACILYVRDGQDQPRSSAD